MSHTQVTSVPINSWLILFSFLSVRRPPVWSPRLLHVLSGIQVNEWQQNESFITRSIFLCQNYPRLPRMHWRLATGLASQKPRRSTPVQCAAVFSPGRHTRWKISVPRRGMITFVYLSYTIGARILCLIRRAARIVFATVLFITSALRHMPLGLPL